MKRNSHGLLQLGREALAYCQCASALISGNKALFASVDLIGEKNQVILEYQLYDSPHSFVRVSAQLSVQLYGYDFYGTGAKGSSDLL